MSSSDTERSFRGFLARSFATLRGERPDAYRAMCATAGALTVRLVVDGERMLLRFDRETVAFREPGDAHVAVETTSRAILDAIAGRATLAALAETNRLEMVGAVEDVLTFHDTLLLYIHGAVRAPSFPRLLRDFRTARSDAVTGRCQT